ncbi:hypothetical protein BDZ94DRAFT_1151585 [Collybia nuda]|uniref:Effector protein n=1 Tax=Collybia nuda TaxID=64659 RepID=A0A9P5YIF5_9AGAR|nr:hypothetical protein BDZ94DRAFT_1151585 [Collybia nuda]
MIFAVYVSLLLAAILIPFGLATSSSPHTLSARAMPDNTVSIMSANDFWYVVLDSPRNVGENIGDSETPGGTKAYCTKSARTSDSQGEISPNFWRDVEYKTGKGAQGGRFAQLTGCINPKQLDRLNPSDSGGQYDSSGGSGGRGNPQGSVCTGFRHYVELIEPRGPRACLKCCDDAVDCPVNKDTQGCPNVIPGNYFNCR